MVTLIVGLLPFLIAFAIFLAKKKKFMAHGLVQITIFIFSVIVLSYFEFGVRSGGGFSEFIKGSSASHDYALFVLILHIVIATITLIMWSVSLVNIKKYIKNGFHKKLGKILFIAITLTTLSSLWVYFLLFVY